ncbi:hypothetical protein LSTR_LSTR013716 [Laodelphax striatellus]|uniref:Uncharacterized protein n=1 Tax=Laodelphax striatellus TaxID=195883 RepID=A0A482WVS9_LAOST|nr:hypothetical protein LSTR_LSTR013716 [Laodelphax striatellus]
MFGCSLKCKSFFFENTRRKHGSLAVNECLTLIIETYVLRTAKKRANCKMGGKGEEKNEGEEEKEEENDDQEDEEVKEEEE